MTTPTFRAVWFDHWDAYDKWLANAEPRQIIALTSFDDGFVVTYDANVREARKPGGQPR